MAKRSIGKVKVQKNPFQSAINRTAQISLCYQNGLQALAHDHRQKINLAEPAQGSVDIDGCVVALYPNDNRWDYVFGYKGRAYFVEVHPANSSEVSVVIAKLAWLKQWLVAHAPDLNAIIAEDAFHWLQSSGFNIPPASRYYRLAEQKRIMPKRSLFLS